MRIYIPFSQAGLAALVSTEGAAGPLPACGVTPALREWFVEGDAEDLEYAAMSRAADLSLAMVAGEPHPRRIVLAADVNAVPSPEVDGTAGVVAMDGITLADVAALHADGDDAVNLVRAAAEALERVGDSGVVPQEVEDLDAYELAWFDPSEIEGLLARWG